MYLKAGIDLTQNLKVTHYQAWVLVLVSGEIQTAECACVAGLGRFYSHAVAILWKEKTQVVLIFFIILGLFYIALIISVCISF